MVLVLLAASITAQFHHCFVYDIGLSVKGGRKKYPIDGIYLLVKTFAIVIVDIYWFNFDIFFFVFAHLSFLLGRCK